MNAQRILIAAFYFVLSIMPIALGGCGGALYQVAPAPTTAPPEISSNNADGLNVGAVALNGDQSIEQFEANLPLAGVIAVDLRVINNSSAPIQTEKLRFELLEAAGAKFKLIKPRKALDRVMKFYGNSFYTLEARRLTRESYDSLGWKNIGLIEPQADRRGFLFFEAKRETSNLSGLSLSITGEGSPFTIAVNPTPGATP
jgi:hypothetical protein